MPTNGTQKEGSNSKGIQLLIKDLNGLLHEASKSGDIRFTLKNGQVVRAHSLLIKTRCKGFKGEANYPYATQEAFQTFLTYVYTGKLKLDSPLSLYPLYLLSLDFRIDDLSSMCEDQLISNLDHDTAIQILQEAVSSLSSSNTQIPTSPRSTPTEDKEALLPSHNGTVSVKSAIRRLTNSPSPTLQSYSTSSNNGSGHTHGFNDEVKMKIQRIVDTCITYLSENNPGNLKRNASFLSLPVKTMKVILDSEHLCLEEEEVWRCVLSWAQHKAGVSNHVSSWTDEERSRVSQYLSPVISNVKLLLIDSRVFAEEVEPTGCVPMALSLERYRYAALSSFDHNPAPAPADPRLMPRNAQKLFHGSMIINTNERVGLGKKLQEWHLALNPGATNSNWKCIYRASHHGFGADEFHARVDGMAPTYVVVLQKNTKWLCGGYTDIPWNSTKSPKYVASTKSFLFAMNPTTNGQPLQLNVVKKHFAVCHDPNSGAIFGAGADLYISSMCNMNADSYTNPHTYEAIPIPSNTNGHSPPSRATTPSTSSASPSGSGTEHAPGVPRRTGKEETWNKNGTPASHSHYYTLAPSYHFTVADYEVFVPTG